MTRVKLSSGYLLRLIAEEHRRAVDVWLDEEAVASVAVALRSIQEEDGLGPFDVVDRGRLGDRIVQAMRALR